MKKIKFQRSIFTKLIIGFIAFFVMFLATFIVCMFMTVATLNDGNFEDFAPYSHIDSFGEITNIEGITNFGGWIEELDSNYNVVKTYGVKRNENIHYTQSEIYSLLSLYDDNEYIGFMSAPENYDNYYLILYQRSSFQIQANLIINEDETTIANSRMNYFVIIFFVLVLLEMVVISLYLRRKIKTPLQQLTEGMERIKAGENNVILDIKTEAEFEQIVDTFNTMTRNLESEKQENRKLVAHKNQLLLELSHDIRTPIATIKSCANALEEGLVPPEKIQSYYHTIDLKADRVKQLSDDMFFMLKAENPDDRLNLEETDICEFLRKICAEYYDEIESSGFTFEIDIPEESFMTYVDRRLFARVIGNLLSNARKYNQTGYVIEIRCIKEEGNVKISVADDGEEIDKSLSEQMFTAFVRGDKTRSSSGGTGLGLSISRIIVEKHGGTLSYKRADNKNVFDLIIKNNPENL